jgi:hypothetical protein
MPPSRFLGITVILVVLILGAGRASPGITEQIAVTFQRVAQGLQEALPPVEGMVVAVNGERVSLEFKERARIGPGTELKLIRRGATFRHPLTGVALGRHEELLGYAQVLEVRESVATARLIPRPEAPPVQVEDVARITRGRIRVAVAPLLDLTRSRPDAKRLPYLLAAALERTGRFTPGDPRVVSESMDQERVRTVDLFATPALAIRLSQKLEVDGWVIPLLVELRGSTVIDATWVSAITGTPLFSHRELLAPAPPQIEQRFPWEPPAP